MIIQTTRISCRSGPQFLAHHLLDKTDDNEAIEILAGDRRALHDAHVLATVKDCKFSIRHLSIAPEFEMSPLQLSEFVRSIDNEFGFGPDRPRLVVRHIKKGRSHFHVAIAEVDPITFRVLDCRKDFARLEKLARSYERAHGESVQLTPHERRSKKIDGFSDVARKKAERISPGFNRTRLKSAFTNGREAFVSEVQRQGLHLAVGEKGPILVNDAGAFVAAANRATGTSRAAFLAFMEEFKHTGNYFCIPTSFDLSGEEHSEPIAAPLPFEDTRGARPHRSAHEIAGAHSGSAAPPGRGTEGGQRANRPPFSEIVGGLKHERLFLHRLTVVDFDNLVQRAREMAVWVQSIFEPQVVSLKRQIQDFLDAGKKIVSADASKPIHLAYNLEKRNSP